MWRMVDMTLDLLRKVSLTPSVTIMSKYLKANRYKVKRRGREPDKKVRRKRGGHFQRGLSGEVAGSGGGGGEGKGCSGKGKQVMV